MLPHDAARRRDRHPAFHRRTPPARRLQTKGYFEVTAFSESWNIQSIQLIRLIFDDADPNATMTAADASYPEFGDVPEPGSLALLALGAGGILARRRRQPAA